MKKVRHKTSSKPLKKKILKKRQLTPLELQKLGLGGAAKGALTGAATGAAMGSVIPIWGTAAGAIIGTVAGGITGHLKEEKAIEAGRAEDALQANVVAEQDFQNNLRTTGNQTGDSPLQMYGLGGMLGEYTGQSHQGPNQGIPVGPDGTPTAMNGQDPTALVEEGEFVYNGKVFSKKLGYAEIAKKIRAKYGKRISDDNLNSDKLAAKSLETELDALYQEQEISKQESSLTPQGAKLELGGKTPSWSDAWYDSIGYSSNNNGTGMQPNLADRPSWMKGMMKYDDEVLGNMPINALRPKQNDLGYGRNFYLNRVRGMNPPKVTLTNAELDAVANNKKRTDEPRNPEYIGEYGMDKDFNREDFNPSPMESIQIPKGDRLITNPVGWDMSIDPETGAPVDALDAKHAQYEQKRYPLKSTTKFGDLDDNLPEKIGSIETSSLNADANKTLADLANTDMKGGLKPTTTPDGGFQRDGARYAQLANSAMNIGFGLFEKNDAPKAGRMASVEARTHTADQQLRAIDGTEASMMNSSQGSMLGTITAGLAADKARAAAIENVQNKNKQEQTRVDRLNFGVNRHNADAMTKEGIMKQESDRRKTAMLQQGVADIGTFGALEAKAKDDMEMANVAAKATKDAAIANSKSNREMAEIMYGREDLRYGLDGKSSIPNSINNSYMGVNNGPKPEPEPILPKAKEKVIQQPPSNGSKMDSPNANEIDREIEELGGVNATAASSGFGDYEGTVLASGKYQITRNTLQNAIDNGIIKQGDMMTPENQEKLGDWLISKKAGGGVVGSYLNGNGSLEKAARGMAQEWAAIATNEGASYYPTNNKATIGYQEILTALKASKKAGNLDALKKIIARGESGSAGYNAWNKGTNGSGIIASDRELDFATISVGDILKRN